MKKPFGLKQLIVLSIAYVVFELVDLAISRSTGVNWFSPRDFVELLGLIGIALLWIWYFIDKTRNH